MAIAYSAKCLQRACGNFAKRAMDLTTLDLLDEICEKYHAVNEIFREGGAKPTHFHIGVVVPFYSRQVYERLGSGLSAYDMNGREANHTLMKTFSRHAPKIVPKEPRDAAPREHVTPMDSAAGSSGMATAAEPPPAAIAHASSYSAEEGTGGLMQQKGYGRWLTIFKYEYLVKFYVPQQMGYAKHTDSSTNFLPAREPNTCTCGLALSGDDELCDVCDSAEYLEIARCVDEGSVTQAFKDSQSNFKSEAFKDLFKDKF